MLHSTYKSNKWNKKLTTCQALAHRAVPSLRQNVSLPLRTPKCGTRKAETQVNEDKSEF